ncbi:acyltransferase [Paenibacillus sp. FJAT-27812]|uniref:acyltransferase n=1 Tax=Paenibacillus sp. FJAT-27812 TaxID=1684143 RepID=UPI0006A7B1BC|nr:acyltransferase [Paenibacillus sp. FJAT-27812]
MYLIIDKIKEKILRHYRKKVFLLRIKSNNNSVNIIGKVYVNATNVKIGNNVTIYPGVMFWGDGEIVIGNNVDIGKDTIIFAKKGVTIGNDVAIAAQCYIIDSNHGIEKNTLIRNQPLDYHERIYIGNDVWIGAGCKILKGSIIQDGAVIGAMSLVNKEINNNAVAYGIPAKIIKFRQ